MIDKFTEENLTEENFKDYILEIEAANLKKIEKEDKKNMVAKIIRAFEGAINYDNK